MTAAWEGGAKELRDSRRGAGAADSRRDTWKCQDSPEAMNPSQRGGKPGSAGRQAEEEGQGRDEENGASGRAGMCLN